METASPGDGPGGLTPKRLSSLEDCLSARRGASADWAAWPPGCALLPHVVLRQTRTRGGRCAGSRDRLGGGVPPGGARQPGEGVI